MGIWLSGLTTVSKLFTQLLIAEWIEIQLKFLCEEDWKLNGKNAFLVEEIVFKKINGSSKFKYFENSPHFLKIFCLKTKLLKMQKILFLNRISIE